MGRRARSGDKGDLIAIARHARAPHIEGMSQLPAPLVPRFDEEVDALARRYRAANGPVMALVNKLGGSLEKQMAFIPDSTRAQIERVVERALTLSYTMAGQGDRLPTTGDRGPLVAAMASGAVGGAGGLPTALAELPVTITVHRPSKPNGAAVVICPGGGYGMLVTGGEGHGIANWLNQHGILAHALDDHVVPIGHSRIFHQALKDDGVVTRLLELLTGDHGLNGYKGPMWNAWQSGSLEWMAELKMIPGEDAGAEQERAASEGAK